MKIKKYTGCALAGSAASPSALRACRASRPTVPPRCRCPRERRVVARARCRPHPAPIPVYKKPYVRRYEYTRVLDSQHLKVTQHPTPRPRPSKKSQTFAKRRERHHPPPSDEQPEGPASGTNLYTILTPSSPIGAALTPLPSPLGLPPASLPQHHCHSITWQRRPRRSRSRPGPRRHPPPPCRRGSAPRRRRLPPRVRRRRCSRR